VTLDWRHGSPDPHYRHRFPTEIISHAVWLYHVFSLSLRDFELLPSERGVVVSYETIRLCLEATTICGDNVHRFILFSDHSASAVVQILKALFEVRSAQ
jgi:hypothetical protein